MVFMILKVFLHVGSTNYYKHHVLHGLRNCYKHYNAIWALCLNDAHHNSLGAGSVRNIIILLGHCALVMHIIIP